MNSIVIWFAALLILCNNLEGAEIQNLQVNYQSEPLGIDVEIPLFSWQLAPDSSERGIFQSAYQIEVKNEDSQTVWNTSKVETGKSVAIRYAGAPLGPTTRYSWEVTIWDQDGKQSSATSWFETGLMNSDPMLSAWDGATWIGGGDEDMVLYAHYLSVFSIQYQVQLDLDSESTAAAFVFGANDPRLMNKDLNLNGMEVSKDESYIAMELDISGIDDGGLAQLNFYRFGYSESDSEQTPFRSFDIPETIIDSGNQYEEHQVYLDAIFGEVEVYINGRDEEHKVTKSDQQGGFGPQRFNLNPFGAGNNFICFPHLGEIGFRINQQQKAKFTNLQIRNYRLPANILFEEKLIDQITIFPSSSGFSISDQGYEVYGGKDGLLLIADPSRNAVPMLRTEFSTENKAITKARMYITARGIYELYINGNQIGDDYFNPGLTQYNRTHMYQAYDVTEQVQQSGENAIGIWLSEGWWSGNITFSGENWNYFGDRQSVLAKLVVTYEDGSNTTITTNPEDWKLYTDGPLRYGSFFQGEVYDASKEDEITGWATAGFAADRWKQAVDVPLESTSVVGEFLDFRGRPKELDYSDQQIIGQIGENAKHVETLVAQSMEEVRPGVYVYDMGQNMVGVPHLEIENGPSGQILRMRYAEVKYPDLSDYEGNVGMIMLENIRAALAQDLYILKGGAEEVQPRFTFHGYRYIEITGLNEALPLEAVQGIVISSVKHLASSYESSNSLVNRLWENITWSLRGNFLSIPTDTPARNERMGWNGDINVFSRAATWLANTNQFLKRHLLAMRDMQADNGRFSDVAPVGNGFGGTLWGSAGIIVAWETYQQYGDISLLEEHYDAMNKYIAFLETRHDEATSVLNEGPLGDWLSPENSKNDNTLLWTAYEVYLLDIMNKVATILDKGEDASEFKKKYDKRRSFFNETFVDPATGKTIHSGVVTRSFGPPPEHPPKKGDKIDTQASYAIPLAFDVFEDQYLPLAVSNLENTILRKNKDDLGVERPEYSLMTGFIGTASIGEALSDHGKDDLAYRMLQNETYPSWLYPVINGATTIWERLNSYTIENGFGGNNSMNSFNHYAFGAIAAWMYNFSLGIQRNPENGGFKEFVIRPTPDPDAKMTFSKGFMTQCMVGSIVPGRFKMKEFPIS